MAEPLRSCSKASYTRFAVALYGRCHFSVAPPRQSVSDGRYGYVARGATRRSFCSDVLCGRRSPVVCVLLRGAAVEVGGRQLVAHEAEDPQARAAARQARHEERGVEEPVEVEPEHPQPGQHGQRRQAVQPVVVQDHRVQALEMRQEPDVPANGKACINFSTPSHYYSDSPSALLLFHVGVTTCA